MKRNSQYCCSQFVLANVMFLANFSLDALAFGEAWRSGAGNKSNGDTKIMTNLKA